jgi:hypothetical protein
MPRALLAAFIVFVLSLGGPLVPSAHAATTCNGAIFNTTIQGDLVVPTGVLCQMQFVTVQGNVLVQPGGSLDLAGGNQVFGHVTGGSGSGFLTVNPGNRVRGDVRFQDASTVVLSSSGGGSRVDGSVTVHGTTGLASVQGATIGGNALFTGNAILHVFNDRIGGWLDCRGNTTVSTGGNTAKGGKRGQCAADTPPP